MDQLFPAEEEKRSRDRRHRHAEPERKFKFPIYRPKIKISDEDLEKYWRQFHESEGFDVDDLPGLCTLNFVHPLRRPYFDDIIDYANFAIESYNKKADKTGGEIELVEILNVNKLCACANSTVYITLLGKDCGDGENKIYQALVEVFPGRSGKRLHLFRQKLTTPQEEDKEKVEKQGSKLETGDANGEHGTIQEF